MAIKTAYYCHKNRNEEQWNRIEDTHNYLHLIFDQKTEIRPMSFTLY
jgi:hypothetical protein